MALVVGGGDGCDPEGGGGVESMHGPQPPTLLLSLRRRGPARGGGWKWRKLLLLAQAGTGSRLLSHAPEVAHYLEADDVVHIHSIMFPAAGSIIIMIASFACHVH